MGRVILICNPALVINDIGCNDRGLIQWVTALGIGSGLRLRITSVKTHMRQGTDRGSTHIFA